MAKKKIILCDTNIIIEFLKNNEEVVQEIKHIGEQSVYISSITAAELYYGALNKTELHQIKKHLDKLVHIPINKEISEVFENIMFQYSLSHNLVIPDAIIAATTIHYQLELYTLNLKDFRFIDGIKLHKQ